MEAFEKTRAEKQRAQISFTWKEANLAIWQIAFANWKATRAKAQPCSRQDFIIDLIRSAEQANREERMNAKLEELGLKELQDVFYAWISRAADAMAGTVEAANKAEEENAILKGRIVELEEINAFLREETGKLKTKLAEQKGWGMMHHWPGMNPRSKSRRYKENSSPRRVLPEAAMQNINGESHDSAPQSCS